MRRGLLAFKVDEVKVVNALYFLELGLQATNLHLRTFLWVTGLEALLMSGNRETFKKRISAMLGSGTFVFPTIHGFPEPKYRVGDIAGDLYDLRSTVAHGRRIPERFRDSRGLIDTKGAAIPGFEYGYREVLHEAALLLLIAVLKKAFIEGHLAALRSEKVWRQKLENGF